MDTSWAVKATLKAEIDTEAWKSLNSDISRAFPKPAFGRIAVKEFNHVEEKMVKVLKVQ